MAFKNDFVFPLDELCIGDADYVGVKNAALGEVLHAMRRRRIRVPDGFATTAEAYWAYLDANGMRPRIRRQLDTLAEGQTDLATAGRRIRTLMLRGAMPEPVRVAIQQAYTRLGRAARKAEADVAVRSSPTVEEMPDVTSAAQQDTFLHIVGLEELLRSVRRCFASLFSDRAIHYRDAAGIDHMSVALSLCVQRMVRADLAGAGMGYSNDVTAGDAPLVRVRAAWGLGAGVVTGAIEPDVYRVSKTGLAKKRGAKSIVTRELGAKMHKRVYAAPPAMGTRRAPVPREIRERFVLNDREILTLARWICAIETHFGGPVTVEWAKDGETGRLHIVQVQPGRVEPPAELPPSPV